MKLVLDERDQFHLLVGHLDPFLVDAVIEFSSDGQPVRVVVPAIRLTTTSRLSRTRPRQFMEM